jgi:hypothetical protein
MPFDLGDNAGCGVAFGVNGPYHLTMDNNDAIETAHAFPQARIVAVHNQGWRHFTESQADLAQAFAALGLAARLQTLEPGRPVRHTF